MVNDTIGLERKMNINLNEIDIVISDMRMPNMSGLQLYKKLQTLNPKLLFIMLSGFVNEITLEEEELAMAKWYEREEIPVFDPIANSLTNEMIMKFKNGFKPFEN